MGGITFAAQLFFLCVPQTFLPQLQNFLPYLMV